MSASETHSPHLDLKAFWTHMLKRHPKERGDGRPTAEGTRWHVLDEFDLRISLTAGSTGVRIFIRGDADAKASWIAKKLVGRQSDLEAALGVPMPSDEHGRFFIDRLDIDLNDAANWNAAADWLFARAEAYEAALNENLGE